MSGCSMYSQQLYRDHPDVLNELVGLLSIQLKRNREAQNAECIACSYWAAKRNWTQTYGQIGFPALLYAIHGLSSGTDESSWQVRRWVRMLKDNMQLILRSSMSSQWKEKPEDLTSIFLLCS